MHAPLLSKSKYSKYIMLSLGVAYLAVILLNNKFTDTPHNLVIAYRHSSTAPQ